MKVLCITHQETRTGAPRVLLDILHRLLEACPEVALSVVSLESGVTTSEFRAIAKEHIAWIPGRNVEEFVVSAQPDVVIVNSSCAHVWAHAAANAGIRSVYLIHEPPFYVERLWQEMAREYTPADSDSIFVVQSEVIDFLATVMPAHRDKLRNIHFSTDRPHAIARSSERSPSSIRRELDCGEGPLFLAIGDAGDVDSASRKGLDRFVDVARTYRSSVGGSAVFTWLGRVTNDSDLEKQANEFIATPGELENVFPWLAACDALLVCSRADPLPLVAIEAMALGKPVFAFRGSGELDKLLDGRMLVEPTPEAMVEALVSLITDQECRTLLQDRCLQIYEQSLPFADPLDEVCSATLKGAVEYVS